MIPVLAVLVAAPAARADVVTDWNAKAEAIGLEKRLQPPPNARTMAMMHVAMFEAANAAQPRYAPYQLKLVAEPGASPEAAAASAAHGVLLGLFPDQQASLDTTLKASLAQVAEGEPRTRGRGAGPEGGGRDMALRAKDGITAAESYRPVTTAGVYVPTVIPVSSTIGSAHAMGDERGRQFRPAPPPALDSPTWTADLNEIREIGGQASKQAHGRADRDRQFWVGDRPTLLEPGGAPARGRQEARRDRQRAAVRAGRDGDGGIPSSRCSRPSTITTCGDR